MKCITEKEMIKDQVGLRKDIRTVVCLCMHQDASFGNYQADAIIHMKIQLLCGKIPNKKHNIYFHASTQTPPSCVGAFSTRYTLLCTCKMLIYGKILSKCYVWDVVISSLEVLVVPLPSVFWSLRRQALLRFARRAGGGVSSLKVWSRRLGPSCVAAGQCGTFSTLL